MQILITNDDGYQAKGIRELAEILSQLGNVNVIAPKLPQSGMAMAVSLGKRPIAHKILKDYGPGNWEYIDATPASCVKFALNYTYPDRKPDVVVCGINHGLNAATAACYSGTLGAAAEGALNGIPAIGVSLDAWDKDADFSAVKKYFPSIFKKLMENYPREKFGVYYNVNFPAIPAEEVKGIKIGHQGIGKWIKEFNRWEEIYQDSSPFEAENDEDFYTIRGEFLDDERNTKDADHYQVLDGWISITANNIDLTDYSEIQRLNDIGFNQKFK